MKLYYDVKNSTVEMDLRMLHFSASLKFLSKKLNKFFEPDWYLNPKMIYWNKNGHFLVISICVGEFQRIVKPVIVINIRGNHALFYGYKKTIKALLNNN